MLKFVEYLPRLMANCTRTIRNEKGLLFALERKLRESV